MRRIKVRAAAIGEKELAGRAARFANALRKGESQQARDGYVLAGFAGTGAGDSE